MQTRVLAALVVLDSQRPSTQDLADFLEMGVHNVAGVLRALQGRHVIDRQYRRSRSLVVYRDRVPPASLSALEALETRFRAVLSARSAPDH